VNLKGRFDCSKLITQEYPVQNRPLFATILATSRVVKSVFSYEERKKYLTSRSGQR